MHSSLSYRLASEGERLWKQGHCLYNVRELWQQAAELDPVWNSALALINALLWRHEEALLYASKSSATLAMYVRAWALADTAMQRGGYFQQTRLWKRAQSYLNAAESRYHCTRPTSLLYLARLYALGRLREFNQAFAFISDIWEAWPWNDSRILFLKAVEKVYLDSGNREAQQSVADAIYSQRHHYPLIASWVVFNQAFIARDLNLFKTALQLHNRVDHHPTCRQCCKYVAQIALLCKDPITYLDDAHYAYPDSAELLEARALVCEDPLSKFRDLQLAFEIDHVASRLNALLHAALAVTEVDLDTILLKALQLHDGIGNCDDCLFLELYVDACCKLHRFSDALVANNRHLQLTMARSAKDPERLSAFESRMLLFRRKLKCRDPGEWPVEYEPVNDEGWTKLTMAAALGETMSLSPDFIEHIDGGGRSPMFVACQRGHADMAAILASYGATKLQYWDVAGRHPLEMARRFLSQSNYEKLANGVRDGELIYEQRRIRYQSELFQILAERGLFPDRDCFGLILQYLGPQYKLS